MDGLDRWNTTFPNRPPNPPPRTRTFCHSDTASLYNTAHSTGELRMGTASTNHLAARSPGRPTGPAKQASYAELTEGGETQLTKPLAHPDFLQGQ